MIFPAESFCRRLCRYTIGKENGMAGRSFRLSSSFQVARRRAFVQRQMEDRMPDSVRIELVASRYPESSLQVKCLGRAILLVHVHSCSIQFLDCPIEQAGAQPASLMFRRDEKHFDRFVLHGAERRDRFPYADAEGGERNEVAVVYGPSV